MKFQRPVQNQRRRRLLQSFAGAALPALGGLAGRAAHAAVQGNANPASWAVNSDPAVYAQAYSRRFKNEFFNPLSLDPCNNLPSAVYRPDSGFGTRYSIATAQTQVDVLGLPKKLTTVWGYQNYETAPTFPGRTFEVQRGTAVTVSWKNNLVNAQGPLPHILPVDQSITMQSPTTGVPLAAHHHGGATAFEFDGGPDQWSTPVRRQVGPGITAANKDPNTPAIRYQYLNTQEASMHWYHDHAESITRINVQAGLAGLYVIRDTNERWLQDLLFTLPKRQYELGLLLQDRNFDANGKLSYSANPADYPDPQAAANLPANTPTHMPEMFGDVIVVNGKAWPNLQVEPRPYRVRLLNGSDSRFYTLNFGVAPVYQIGTDLGLLNKGVQRADVTIAPGERLDLVVDFSNAKKQRIVVTNSAATPFPGGQAPVGGATQVMRIEVKLKLNAQVPLTSPGLLPHVSLRRTLDTPPLPKASQKIAAMGTPPRTRRILLAEGTDQFGRITPLLGTYDPANPAANLGTLSFHDPATERPGLNTQEVWEFWNASVDAHPVHVHLVQFQVLDRREFAPATLQAITMSNGWTGARLNGGVSWTGAAQAAPAFEDGWKDTVVCPPNAVTRVLMKFDQRGKYVYHCHILSHEEHDMMRWFEVV